ncbi:alpha/beta fold hydrolase [Undibacterium sp. MH2W]|uniref:alpha/beta fold hydrolase n=1 Tax=Undibacterium sp. MH2W TaxID=3413044 RepID=UPI003BF25CF7
MLKFFIQKLVGLSGLLLCSLAYADVQHPLQQGVTPCRLPDFPQELRCGKIERPLNPDDAAGKKIEIQYVVLPSQDKNKLQDAIFLLAGGPGQSAINVASFGQAILSRLNKRRDIVFVDQRGTGRSAPLACPEIESGADVDSEDQIAKRTDACLARLKALPYGDLRYFSTSIAVQDLEAVRKQQGYEKINLVGASYGTRVGLEYLRQFPHSVKRLVLDGVVPPDMGLPASDAQVALDGVFADCAKQVACRSRYPDLAQKWHHLLASMPRHVSMTHPRLGTPLEFDMQRDMLLSLVHKTLYSAPGTAALPYAITQADQGHFQPLVTLSGATNAPGPAGITYGMHFSVWCSEIFARPLPIPKDDFEQIMTRMYERACKNWPRASIPEGFFTIPVTQSPVLLLSGGIDPVTPIRHGDAVAKALGANALHVTLNNSGHGVLSQGCVRDVVYRFLNAKEDHAALQIDTSCVRPIPRPLAWQPLQDGQGKQEKQP